MLCQNCHRNQATIHLFVNQNGHRQRIDICQNCYQLLTKSYQNGGINMAQNPFGFGDLNDVFRAMQAANGGAHPNQQNVPPKSQVNRNNGNNSVLGRFGINMTQLAKDGKIDPVIGRDAEIKRVIEILNRRNKNNPVLIGEAGVGKTAVVEGLALAIAAGNVPAKLRSKQVIRLDVVSLVQGTGVRGQFEQRMQKLVQEVQKNPDVILFIDEIHQIMGAGNADGGMDAGNVLKPALARGEFQLIGATTMKEYRKIERDAALARRFQTVTVQEPSPKAAIQILEGIQGKYESYHHVKYSKAAIKAAVKLSDRYIQGRFLPDKAIDLIDEAGSRKNLTLNAVDPETVDRQIAHAEEQKQTALRSEDYEKAAYYRDQAKKYSAMKQNGHDNPDESPEVTVHDIEKIVEEITAIPVGALQAKEQKQLKGLAPELKKHIIGQDAAVDTVARAIKRNRIGFNGTGRPIGSFLFVGTTGIGKTELAKQLAKELFGTENAMIRFDMSEYREPHSIAKLIGSPPGYVGYEEAGQLTEKVRRNPYSLILFDEIEKANPDVLHAFLQILDDGRMTDSQGRTVSFKDTVIIMTSNAGTGNVEANVGFGASASGETHSALNHLSEYFKPEFLNRFDSIVEFQPLSKASLKQIVTLMLANMNRMLASQGIQVQVSDGVKDQIVDRGFNPAMGARPLRRLIQDLIEDRVADYYLDHPDAKQLKATLNPKYEITIAQNE